MKLIGQNSRGLHIRVVGAGGGFLLPGGVVIALELAVGVAGHVPHVRDGRRGLAAPRRGVQRILVVLMIPKMNPRVMNRVQRLDREHLLYQGID